MKFESLLGGSIVRFKKRERPEFSDAEQDIETLNKRKLGEGITALRKLRTAALELAEGAERQEILAAAHAFAKRMAEVILDIGEKTTPVALDEAFGTEIETLLKENEQTEPGTGHGLPPQFSVGNLLLAADDIAVRLEEILGNDANPDRKLSKEELRYVLSEFLLGTNWLSPEAIERVLSAECKVGGILTGGAVYMEMAKKIIERHAEKELSLETFVIAVDKEAKRTAFEHAANDASVKEVVIVDDMIDRGGTMITAFRSAGEFFPNARITCEKGTEYPGEWNKRRIEAFETHLGMRFQDYADEAYGGNRDEALRIFSEAEAYAKEHGVELTQGWHIIKAKIDRGGPMERK